MFHTFSLICLFFFTPTHSNVCEVPSFQHGYHFLLGTPGQKLKRNEKETSTKKHHHVVTVGIPCYQCSRICVASPP